MYEDLTPRQKEVLQYIQSFFRQKGYPPSVREIGRAVGLRSTSTVHGHIKQLESKGYLRKDPANRGPSNFWTQIAGRASAYG